MARCGRAASSGPGRAEAEVRLAAWAFEQVRRRLEHPVLGQRQPRGAARALRLVGAQDQPAAVLQRLQRPQPEREAVEGERAQPRVRRGADPADEQRSVEVLRLGEHAALQPPARVRVERVDHLLDALVGQRIGPRRRAQEAQPELGAERVMAVAPVVEQRGAVARLGEVGEAVARDLEARLVPGRVAVRGALDHAEGGLEARALGAHGEREARLHQPAAVVPLEAGGEVDPRGSAHSRTSWTMRLSRNARRHGRGAVRAALDDRGRLGRGELTPSSA